MRVRGNIPYERKVKTVNGEVGICHAQPPTWNWDHAMIPNDKDIKIMLWARNWITNDKQDKVHNIHQTYHGHTPVDEVKSVSNSTFIDTGAFFTNNLTMIKIN